MENFQVYRDIQARTGGDIYIGGCGTGPYRKIHIHPEIYGADSTAIDQRGKKSRTSG